jgi:hypothetical protein
LIAASKDSGEANQISEEERQIRCQESDLLVKISAPPAIGEDSLKKLVNRRREQLEQSKDGGDADDQEKK